MTHAHIQIGAREMFGQPATVGNGSQVSFLTDSTATVDALWADALRAGGTDEGAPGLRPQYASDFYAAYCRDPEGHKLCFVYTSSNVGDPAEGQN